MFCERNEPKHQGTCLVCFTLCLSIRLEKRERKKKEAAWSHAANAQTSTYFFQLQLALSKRVNILKSYL